MPLWAIITTCVLSCLLICAVVAFLIIYFREKERVKTRERIERQFRMAETKKLTRYLQQLRERMMFRNQNAQMSSQPNPNFQGGFPANGGPPRVPTQPIHPPPHQMFNQMGHPVNHPPQIQQPAFNTVPLFAPPVIPPQNVAPNFPPQPMGGMPPNPNSNVTQGTIPLTVHDPSLIPEGPPPIPPPGYVTVPIVLQNENHQ